MKLTQVTGKLIATGLLALALFTGQEARAEGPDDLLIIGNNSVEASSLSLAEVKRLFLKETETAGGEKVIAINAKDGAEREAFRAKVLGMSKAEEEKFWQDAQVRSGASAPKEFGNSLKAVFSVKKGIGYCFRKDFKEGLGKVLLSL